MYFFQKYITINQFNHFNNIIHNIIFFFLTQGPASRQKYEHQTFNITLIIRSYKLINIILQQKDKTYKCKE